jgi:hypothetical protein
VLLSSERATQGSESRAYFLEQRTLYLVDGSYSPMSVMVSLLLYAKYLALCTPSRIASSMWWSADEGNFFLKGRPIELAAFRTMAQGVVAEAERVLWEDVLWGARERERPLVDLPACFIPYRASRCQRTRHPPSATYVNLLFSLAFLISIPLL